jgi:uncharacterized repeat protein (TIGR01451 family)
MTRPWSRSRKIAVAAAAALTTIAAFAGILAVVQDNFVIDSDAMLTYIYPTTDTTGLTPADANGYLVIDEKEDVVAPGVAVYQEGYRSGDITFNGCIMAAKDPLDLSADKCRATPDSGKRFKLRGAKLNQPIDIVFTVATVNQEVPFLLYNVYGKLTNDTGIAASGFKVQIGKGIGAGFVESAPGDGLALKTIADYVGKFPGGLFGGSPAEGLPFFSKESAYFGWSQIGDTLATTGVPTPYADLFGDWQTEGNVPVAWFLDIDGRPWTDDKLQAWLQDGKWYTYTKSWTVTNIAVILADFIDGQNQDTIDFNLLPVELNPVLTPYVDLNELTAWMNDQAGLTGTDSAFKTQEVVEALLPYLVLTREEILQPTLDTWLASPVTVRFSADANVAEPTAAEAANWPLVATWHPELGEEGLYVIEAAYAADPVFTGLVETVDGQAVVTADEMATIVKDNTGANTDYFGIPGYSLGVIEDLSNVNGFFAIEVDPTASPAGTTEFTMRLTFTGPEAEVADLNLSAAGTSAAIGDDGSVSFTVLNQGPGVARNVVLSGTVPAGTTLAGVGDPASCTVAGQDFSCTIAELASGASQALSLTLNGGTAGDYPVTGTVTGYAVDNDATDNSATATFTVTQTDGDDDSSDSFGCSMSSGKAPFDPTLWLLGALALAGIGLRRLGRSQR